MNYIFFLLFFSSMAQVINMNQKARVINKAKYINNQYAMRYRTIKSIIDKYKYFIN